MTEELERASPHGKLSDETVKLVGGAIKAAAERSGYYVGNPEECARAAVWRFLNAVKIVGWALVPIEPTEEMILAGKGALKTYFDALPAEERRKYESTAPVSNGRGYWIYSRSLKFRLRWKAMVAAATRGEAK